PPLPYTTLFRSAITRDNQPGTNALRLAEPSGPEVVAVANAVRHERMDRRAGAAEHAREHRRATLAVDVVITMDENRPLLADRPRQELDRHGHVCPAMRV